jgi:hypothetical protein
MQSGPTLVFLFGPPAVGKMTVGQELSRLTGMRLFYNHRILDLVTDYLPFGSPEFLQVLGAWNDAFYDALAEAGTDVIVTFGWDFDAAFDHEAAGRIVGAYLARGGQVCAVELMAPLAVRIERNRTEHRRRHKKVAWATEESLTALHEEGRWDSGGTAPFGLPYLRLETADLAAEAAARAICAHFQLPEA